jgi:acetyl-CoA carboxylase biotin carboxyl carrier protein
MVVSGRQKMKQKEIETLMDKFDQSSMKEFKITTEDGDQLYFSKLDHPAVVAAKNIPEGPTTVEHDDTNSQPNSSQGAKIKAPLVGIVYFAPSPSKPVYKKVGDHVQKGDVVCVIEAMKVINEVKSPVTGTITKKVAANGDMVEYDQPIFEVEED